MLHTQTETLSNPSVKEQTGTLVALNTVRWDKASYGVIPPGAVCGGQSHSGEEVFVGRLKLQENKDELTPGVIIPSEK